MRVEITQFIAPHGEQRQRKGSIICAQRQTVAYRNGSSHAEAYWPVSSPQPWLLEIWEPLKTKAPNPSLARPYCCYISTVIFYLHPYQVTQRSWPRFNEDGSLWYVEKPGRVFEEWDRADAVIDWHSRVEFGGEVFEVVGGTVVWKHRRWWMLHRLRRRRGSVA